MNYAICGGKSKEGPSSDIPYGLAVIVPSLCRSDYPYLATGASVGRGVAADVAYRVGMVLSYLAGRSGKAQTTLEQGK